MELTRSPETARVHGGGVARPGDLRPRARGRSLRLYNNSGAEKSRVARTSDDRARRTVTRTTRRDKRDREKWDEGGGGEEDEQQQRERGGESRSGSNGRVCVQTYASSLFDKRIHHSPSDTAKAETKTLKCVRVFERERERERKREVI